MANLTPFSKDMEIIGKLDDEPNDVGGLTAAELKAKFDEAGQAIKDYMNDTLIKEIEGNGGDTGLVGEKIKEHNAAPDSHADIRQKIADDIASHDGNQDAHPALRERITENKNVLSQHISDKENPHGVTAAQVGADPVGTTTVASCADEAAPASSTPNTWYVSKDVPRPSGEAGMMLDVRWANGHVGGLGYNVTLIWGAPGAPDNETILSGISVTDNLTGEVSIPTEGTIRYQLEEADGRKRWRYVSGTVLSRQYSSATAADAADKAVPGLELSYVPGMEIYLQLDRGNTAETMRLVPDSGPTLPVYGNGKGATTGDIPAGFICHLVNAEDHWQMTNTGSGGGDGKPEVALGDGGYEDGLKVRFPTPDGSEIVIPGVLQDDVGDSTEDTMSQKAIKALVSAQLGGISTLVGGGF